MSALRIEFAHINPEDARKFLRHLWTRYGLAPIPASGGRFADPEEACELALGEATRLSKWFQRLRHPRSVRLVVYVDNYQPEAHTDRSDRGAADTAPGQANHSARSD